MMNLDAMLEEMMINDILDFLNDDVKTTKDLLAELDELEAAIETKEEDTVEVLLDVVAYDEKPQGTTIGAITKRLPKQQQAVSLKELAEAVSNGQSWKAAVLSDTNNSSFVSSSLVALDIDNKASYTTIEEFMALNHKYQPCFIYETFSSTEQHERFRVVYAFDTVIKDYSTMVALYNEVKAQYPTVDIDDSVDPGKVLFGGKALRAFNSFVNDTPAVEPAITSTETATRASRVEKVIEDKLEITELDIMMNLSDVAYKYADVKEIDINNSYEWINQNVKMTEALGIEENTRFRCILPNHEDNHPSARIANCGEEQVYFCSCEANGYRLISLLSKVLDMSEVKVKTLILKAINVSYGSEYQKATERYIADLRRNLTRVMTQDLKDYLHKRKLLETYKLIIEFADAHIPYNSFANDNRVVFFMGKRTLKEEMKQNYISGDADRKLLALCELGLLRKLTDSEIKNDVLVNAERAKKDLQRKLAHNTNTDALNLNRVDFYELVDLSPSVVSRTMDIVKAMKDNAVRQRGSNINRRINAFGEEEVLNNINVQSSVDSKKNEKIRAKLQTIIDNTLATNKYFSEDDLKNAYYATDKKHLTKAKAQQVVLDFIPSFITNGTVKRVRVNKESRKQYNISSKYKSNTYVYVAK